MSVFFKKLMATMMTLSLAVVATTANAAGNLGFTDDASIPDWSVPAIEGLMDLGVLSGNDDNSFAPQRQLNRAEVAKIIVLATGIPFDVEGGPHFPDVQPGAWYYDFVETMYNYGWINGYPDGMFRPGVGINRAEIAKMVVNAFGFPEDTTGGDHFSDVTTSDWFYGYVETAYNYQLMDGYGDGTFGPALPVSRAETAAIVWNAYLQWSIPVGPVSGTLEVMLSGDTPRGTNIPFNAVSVPYTTVEFTAADDSDIDVASLTFTRLGLGDADAFDKCWYEVEGFKISNEASVNVDDISTIRFNPPMIVPAGTTVIGDLVCSLDDAQAVNVQGAPDNAGQTSRFAIVSPDDIVSSATSVVGAFPVDGEEMRIAEYAVSELEFNCLGADTIVNVGTSFVEIGKFKLLNDSSTNKDVLMRAVTFKNDGTADLEDIVANAALYVSGEQVSVETIADGDYLSFLLDDGVTGGLVIEDGDSIIFSIRADIISAEQNDTIQFELDNAEDLVGIEIGTSFGVRVVDEDGRLAEDSRASCSTYTLDAGDLTLSRDPSSLGNQEYSPGSDDVVGQTCRVVAQQPVVTDGIEVCLSTGSIASDKDSDGVDNELEDFNETFSNFRLYIDDTLIDNEDDLYSKTSSTGDVTDFCLEFSTTFEVTGTSIMKLVANIEDDAISGDKVKFEIDADEFVSPEYITTGDQLDESQTVGICTGSFVEVQESKIVLAKTDPNNNGDSFVAGSDGLNVLSFAATLNDSGDSVVTSVTVEAVAMGAACQLENVTGAFFVNGTQVGSPQSLDTVSGSSNGSGSCVGQATFGDLSVVIPSGEQVEFDFIVDTSEVLASTSITQTVVTDACSSNLSVDVDDNDYLLRLADASCFVPGDAVRVTNETHRILLIGDGVSTAEQLLTTLYPGMTADVTSGTLFDAVYGTDSTGSTVVTAGLTTGCPVTGLQGADGRVYCDNYVPRNHEILVVSEDAPFDATTASMAVFDPGAPVTACPLYATTNTTPANGLGFCSGVYNEFYDVEHMAASETATRVGRVVEVDETTSIFAGGALAAEDTVNACFTVADGSDFSAGQAVDFITNTLGATVAATVSSVGTTQICANFVYPVGATVPHLFETGTIIRAQNSGTMIRFRVSDFQADNVENGSDVTICEGVDENGDDAALAALLDESLTGEDEDCDINLFGDSSNPATSSNSATNYLCGAKLNLSSAGILTVNSFDDNLYPDIIVQNENGTPVFELRLAATDDKIEVTDLYLMNDLDIDGAPNSLLTLPTAPFSNTGKGFGASPQATIVYDNTVGAVCAVADIYDNIGNAVAVPSTDGSQITGTAPFMGIDSLGAEGDCSPAALAVVAAVTPGTTPVTLYQNTPNEYDVEDILTFELYNAAGQLIDTERMTNGRLHFDLGNSSRIIVPKDGSTTVTVKVKVARIDNVQNTGLNLRLVLDENRQDTQSGEAMYGVEAVTSATGLDLDPTTNATGNQFLPDGSTTPGYGSATGDVYTFYKTEMAVTHMEDSLQPDIAASSGLTDAYRFTVTANSEGPVLLKRLTFQMNLSGMALICPFSPGDHYDSNFVVTDPGAAPVINGGAAGATITPCTVGSTDPIVTLEEYGNASNNIPFDIGTVRVLTTPGSVPDGAAGAPAFDHQKATLQVNFGNGVTGGEIIQSSKSFVLRVANTEDTNLNDNDDQVSVTILRDDVFSGPNILDFQMFKGADPLENAVNNPAKIVWSDMASNLISGELQAITQDWLNGYLLEIDTDSQTNRN